MPPDNQTELTGLAGTGHVLSTVPAQRGEVLSVDLKPAYTSLGLPPSTFTAEVQGARSGPIFDAAVGGGTTYEGIVWIFMGEDYLRLDMRTNTLSGPATTAARWGHGRWPPTFASGIDAAVTFTNEPGLAWFFQGSRYIRYNLAADVVEGGPVEIAPNWPGWPASFTSGVDAAAPGVGAYEGMAWFFKGSEYIRYNNNAGVGVDVGPTPIAAAWRGWPEDFGPVDCTISGEGRESAVIYFFSGADYLAYDLRADEVIAPPRPISSKWPMLSQFMRRPQLFLRESLQLKTFYGDVMAGPLQGDSIPLMPNSEQTYTMIVRRSETSTLSETTTVLESQDERLVDEVNSSMRDDSATGRSSEKYDYHFDSSFEGDLSYTGLGGSVDASLNFQGGSNTVREHASEAAMKAVQKQVGRAEENRRQSTRVVQGTQTTTNELESTFTQTVRNPTDHSITVAVYLLKQEYIALTVLTDVRAAFSNGGPPDIVSLEQLDVLLGRYVADQTQAGHIKEALLAELKAMLDYRKRPVTVLKDVGGGRVAFDPEFTSTYMLLNPDGTPRRPITVRGVIVGTDTFTQLTQSTLLQELTVG